MEDKDIVLIENQGDYISVSLIAFHFHSILNACVPCVLDPQALDRAKRADCGLKARQGDGQVCGSMKPRIGLALHPVSCVFCSSTDAVEAPRKGMAHRI